MLFILTIRVLQVFIQVISIILDGIRRFCHWFCGNESSFKQLIL